MKSISYWQEKKQHVLENRNWAVIDHSSLFPLSPSLPSSPPPLLLHNSAWQYSLLGHVERRIVSHFLPSSLNTHLHILDKNLMFNQ